MIGRIWLATIGLLALIVLVWFAALWVPTNQRLDRAHERLDTAQAAVDELEVQRERLVAANRDVPVLQTQLRELAAAVPDSLAVADLMLAVSEAEADSGVEIAAVTTADPVADGEGLVEIGLELDVRASYFQLLDFVNRLGRLERLYVIDAIEIDALGDEASIEPPELDVTLLGRVFTANDGGDVEVPQPVELSSVPGPAPGTVGRIAQGPAR